MRNYVMTRESEIGFETIYIGDYGFEWWVNKDCARTGLVENLDEDIASLTEIGFEIQE